MFCSLIITERYALQNLCVAVWPITNTVARLLIVLHVALVLFVSQLFAECRISTGLPAARTNPACVWRHLRVTWSAAGSSSFRSAGERASASARRWLGAGWVVAAGSAERCRTGQFLLSPLSSSLLFSSSFLWSPPSASVAAAAAACGSWIGFWNL